MSIHTTCRTPRLLSGDAGRFGWDYESPIILHVVKAVGCASSRACLNRAACSMMQRYRVPQTKLADSQSQSPSADHHDACRRYKQSTSVRFGYCLVDTVSVTMVSTTVGSALYRERFLGVCQGRASRPQVPANQPSGSHNGYPITRRDAASSEISSSPAPTLIDPV